MRSGAYRFEICCSLVVKVSPVGKVRGCGWQMTIVVKGRLIEEQITDVLSGCRKAEVSVNVVAEVQEYVSI